MIHRNNILLISILLYSQLEKDAQQKVITSIRAREENKLANDEQEKLQKISRDRKAKAVGSSTYVG